VTGFEAALASPFTADTVAFLKRRFPGVHFVWIKGGDNLAQFARWRHWRRIFRTMPVALLDRPLTRHKALASPAAQQFAAFRMGEAQARSLPLMTPPAWVYLTIRLTAASSTQLRRANKSNA
jgi:nicotinate-nucleotide adenylyltransferase